MNATIEGLQELVAPAALAKVGKVLPQVAMVAVVALIAWQMAQFTWALLPRPAEARPSLMATQTPVSAPKPLNSQRIADAHLFGQANVTEPSNVDVVTKLTLVLSGTIASSDPEKGFAFIGESAAAAKFLKVGDTVAGAARLHSVYADRVILDRSGSLEALFLPKTDSGILNARPAIAMTAPPTRFADNIRRIAETNPAAFNEILRPQPYIEKGVMQGFRVYPGRTRGQFTKLGLQPGDLVKAINGTPLDDPQRSNEIFGTISASDRVQLTIERNGQTVQLLLNTSQINLPQTESANNAATPPQDTQLRDPSAPPETP